MTDWCICAYGPVRPSVGGGLVHGDCTRAYKCVCGGKSRGRLITGPAPQAFEQGGNYVRDYYNRDLLESAAGIEPAYPAYGAANRLAPAVLLLDRVSDLVGQHAQLFGGVPAGAWHKPDRHPGVSKPLDGQDGLHEPLVG